MSRPFGLVFVLDLSFDSVAIGFAIFVLSALDFSELKRFNGNLYQLLMKNVDFSNRQVESQLVTASNALSQSLITYSLRPITPPRV